jgi:hypothetical protein
MEKNVTNNGADSKKIVSFITDTLTAILLISAVNFFIVLLFGFSESTLMKEGIQTSLLERKLEIYDYVSLGYLTIMVVYLIFGRKYFSLGDRLLNKKK